MGRTVRILDEEDVRATLDMASCIDAVQEALIKYSTGRSEQPSVIHLEVPEAQGEIHVKAGHLHGAPRYVVKVSSGFYGTEPPSYDGVVIVFDARTGAPVAFLLDNGFVTDQRTAAAGGVAARYLAPERVETVAVIGTGIQARAQLEALAVVRPGVCEVKIWGRNPDRARRCVEDVRLRLDVPEGCAVDSAASIQHAVEGADVVITCTGSREPLVRAEWLALGVHVTALGSDGPDKQELHPDVLARADLVVVDSRDQCARMGELHHAIDAGLFQEDRPVELGEICAGERRGRTRSDQLTVCDLTGLGVQDVAAAALVLERSGTRGRVLEL